MNACCCFFDAVGIDAVCFVERPSTAAKTYYCNECHKRISPGDVYEYVHGKWGETWHTFRTCRLCAIIRNDLFTCGFIYGLLKESLQECYGVDL